MSRKEDLESLILSSYEVIRANDQNIRIENPRERIRLQQENEEEWGYIKGYLAEYTVLCERLGLTALEPVLQIAAARFAELADRLILAHEAGQKQKTKTSSVNTTPPSQASAFQLNCSFTESCIPVDKDTLVQFTIEFESDSNAALRYVDVIAHICLVLDVSGSMNESAKYPYLLEAVPFVLQSLSENDWLTIILFSTESEIIWSRDVKSSRDRVDEIIQLINQSRIKFNQTYLYPALQIAISEIKKLRQIKPDAVTRLYILTDGQLHDSNSCYSLNTELRRLEIEINSYGFGQDFAEDTMRLIIEGCQGGRIKWVGKTDTLWESFRHIGETASRIIATEAELTLVFSANVTPGDAFRSAPGTAWLGSIDDQDKHFHIYLHTLERERAYVFAFEARTYPSGNETEQIATATLSYLIKGQKQILVKEVSIERKSGEQSANLNDPKIKNMFLALEGLRSKEGRIQLSSLQARLQILLDEGGDKAQIELIKKAIGMLEKTGTLSGLSSVEMRRLSADNRTTVG